MYILDNEFITTSEEDFIEVRSLEAGKSTLLEIDDTLTVTEPVLGLEKITSVSSIVVLALSEESVDDYRRSIEKSIQLEPQGGARTDYREWASDAQGVREVYPYLKESSAGTVQVFVEATKEDSINGNGVPSAPLLASVESVILFDPDTTVETNARGRKPMQCTLEVLPISLIPVDITVTSLNENSSDITNSLRDNLEVYLSGVRPYIAGTDLARNKNDILYLAKSQSVVTDTLSTGNFFNGITMLVDGVSQNSYLFSRDKIPYLRNLIFN